MNNESQSKITKMKQKTLSRCDLFVDNFVVRKVIKFNKNSLLFQIQHVIKFSL
jgi:hypothetical protein